MSRAADRERSPERRDARALRRAVRSLAQLVADERGVVQTEYTIVLVLVAIVAALAVGALSWPLLQYHRSITDQVTSPVP